MAKSLINRFISPLIRIQNPKISIYRSLTTNPTSSSADIYWTHLQKNSSHPEWILNKVKANLDTSSVKEVLNKSLKTQPLLGLRFFIWAGTQSQYRHSSYMYRKVCELFDIADNPGLIFDVIEGYKAGNCTISPKMFRVVLGLCREAKLADEGLWVLNKMKESNLNPDTMAYNVVIWLFCEKGSMDVASELMGEMGSVHLYPDMVTYIAMIKGFCELGRLEDACVLFRDMKKHRCEPNAVAYSALLEGVCRYGSLDKALELLAEMEKESGVCSPNVVTYTTLIQGFCERGRTMEALSILDRMQACGCAPNRVTLGVLIKGFCTEGLLEEAYKLIDRVVSQGCVLGSECYSSLVISLIRIGEFEEAEKLFRKMVACDIKPDGLASSTMLKDLCSKGRILDAFYIYSLIEKSGFLISIDSDIYSIILDGLCRGHHLAEVVEFIKLIPKRNFRLSSPYEENIVAYLKSSGKEDLVTHFTCTQK